MLLVYSTSCSSTSKPIASSHWGAATPAAYVHPSNTHEVNYTVNDIVINEDTYNI